MIDRAELLEDLAECLEGRHEDVRSLGQASPASLEEARTALWDRLWPHLQTAHLPADLPHTADALAPYRRAALGLGCLSTGYLLPALARLEDLGTTTVEETTVHWDANPSYAVNLDLLCHPDNTHLFEAWCTAGTWDPTHRQLVPHDVAKDTSPPHRGWTVDITPPHRDQYVHPHYLQGCVEDSAYARLCYLPGSSSPRARRLLDQLAGPASGYSRLPMDEALEELLYTYGRMPPRGSYVVWEPGVVHWESRVDDPKSTEWQIESDTPVLKGDQRTRYYLGAMDVEEVPRPVVEAYAWAAEQGLSPSPWNQHNRGAAIDPLLVMRKSTRYLRPRTVSGEERRANQRVCRHPELPTLTPDREVLYGLRHYRQA